jgi:hypothetical protein
MNLTVYIINVIVCISIIIFCGTRVIMDQRPETTSIYLPIMSAIVSYFVPNPKLDKKENKNPLIQQQQVLGSGGSNGSVDMPLSPISLSNDRGVPPALSL